MASPHLLVVRLVGASHQQGDFYLFLTLQQWQRLGAPIMPLTRSLLSYLELHDISAQDSSALLGTFVRETSVVLKNFAHGTK